MYWNGNVIMECTKVVFDASDPTWVSIRFMQNGQITAKFTIHLAPQDGKKFNFYNGVEGFDQTVLLEQVNDTSAVESAETSEE